MDGWMILVGVVVVVSMDSSDKWLDSSSRRLNKQNKTKQS